MDLHQHDSEPEEESVKLEKERGDAVIAHCSDDKRNSSSPNRVTKILISSVEPDHSVAEIPNFTNDFSPDTVISAESVDRNLHSPCAPSSCKPLEVLPHVDLSERGMEALPGAIQALPELSSKFRNSIRSEVLPPSKNPFHAEAEQASNVSSLPVYGTILKKADPSIITPENYHPSINQPDSAMPSGAAKIVIDHPDAFHNSDVHGNATKSSTSPIEVQNRNNPATAEGDSPGCPPSNCEKNNSTSTDIAAINVPNESHPVHHLQHSAGSQNPQPLIADCCQEQPIKESPSPPGQSEYSFHFLELPSSKQIICDEPPEHLIISDLKVIEETPGKIVPITIQRSYTSPNDGKAREEPTVTVGQLTTYSASPFQTKAMDEPDDPLPLTCHRITHESKTNNLYVQEKGATAGQSDHEEQEHGYEFIQNEDNLIEITLPPSSVIEGSASHQDHEGDSSHSYHKIRTSLNRQSATPSRRAIALASLLLVLLISAIVLFGMYKFAHKSFSD